MAYNLLNDDALVQLICCRDAAALSALYDRYARQAHAVALLVTREPAAAEAIVEDLVVDVWRGVASSPGTSVRNSLMLSARRLAEQSTFAPRR